MSQLRDALWIMLSEPGLGRILAGEQFQMVGSPTFFLVST
jgi:hypothetical protein